MESNRACHAVHREVASDIAGLRPGLFDAATLKRDLRKLRHIEKFRAAQVVVALGNPSIDAADCNLSHDRRILNTIAVDLDRSIELLKLANGRAKEMTDFESDCRMSLVELVGFIRDRVRNKEGRCSQEQDEPRCCFHGIQRLALARWLVVRALSKGVRDIGNFPNKLPRANAGSFFNTLAAWTPVTRASSASKCATARRSGSE